MEKRCFSVGEFDGPLELLWKLIRDCKVSVFDIPIKEITEQYLSWLDKAKAVELGDLSDFYRMAAKLVLIKTSELLPKKDDGTEDFYEDDPREELVESLIEYQRFKLLTSMMEKIEADGEWEFERKKIKRELPENKMTEMMEIDTSELLLKMQKLFYNIMSKYSDSRILDMYEEVSVGEKLTLIEEHFKRKGECFFSEIVGKNGTLLDFVCSFMAVLEAVKFKIARVYQSKMFGDIKICRY